MDASKWETMQIGTTNNEEKVSETGENGKNVLNTPASNEQVRHKWIFQWLPFKGQKRNLAAFAGISSEFLWIIFSGNKNAHDLDSLFSAVPHCANWQPCWMGQWLNAEGGKPGALRFWESGFRWEQDRTSINISAVLPVPHYLQTFSIHDCYLRLFVSTAVLSLFSFFSSFSPFSFLLFFLLSPLPVTISTQYFCIQAEAFIAKQTIRCIT